MAVLVKLDGAKGAALGTAGGEVMLALLSAWALTRADRRLMPPLRIVPTVALATGLASLTVLVGLPVLVTCIAAGAIYVFVVVALRAVPQEVWQHFSRRPA